MEGVDHPITSIAAEARHELRRRIHRWRIPLSILFAVWIIFVFGIVPHYALIENIQFFIIVPLVALFGWYAYVMQDIRQLFWMQVATHRGMTYVGKKDISAEKALFFTRGDNGTTYNTITGMYGDLPLSLFEYHYTVGSGKNKTTHLFTVCEVRFKGSFPHLYLNFRKDGLPRSGGFMLPQISLPTEFEKQFQLFAPEQYEIEALEIFTPDTLTFLLENEWKYDLELVESELLIFRRGTIESRAELDSEYLAMIRFIDHLAPRLNRMTLAPIGDHSPLLS